jgi:hypothetical protein
MRRKIVIPTVLLIVAGGRCRSLFIEDEHESAEQIVESLVASGYEVDLVADGDDGLGRAWGFPLIASNT